MGGSFFCGRHGLLDRLGDPLPAVVADLGGQLGAVVLEDRGAGVAGLVDAVAEAHDPLLAGQGLLDPPLGVLGRADLLQDLPRLLVGPAVERALERADRRDDPRIDVRERRDRHPGRERRGVQLVLGVEDQREVERLAHRLGDGTSPLTMWRKFAAWSRSSLGRRRAACPWLIRSR